MANAQDTLAAIGSIRFGTAHDTDIAYVGLKGLAATFDSSAITWEPLEPDSTLCREHRGRGNVACDRFNDHDGSHIGEGRDKRVISWPDPHGSCRGRLRARQRRVEISLDGGCPLAWLF